MAISCFSLAVGLTLISPSYAEIVPNRTAPNVAPPKTGLEFSATPTAQEIFSARVFEEPLVPIGGEAGAEENAALAAALRNYAKRTGPDDFASLESFLKHHPKSPWAASLWTGLGLEYYNTAHYSKALASWQQAWALTKDATDPKGKAITDRAAGELAYMYARLGRMTELDVLLKSVEGRVFIGPATEKISGAREGLWNMQNRPEIAFRCGPLALHRIKRLTGAQSEADMVIFNSASTQNGLSLPQLAELSKKVGLNYQMALREKRGDFIIPSVVHWKVGHYAAMVRQEGDKYLLEDPTFGNTVWATRDALEAETSGYFLIPPGPLPKGWRAVETKEGEMVWGKGFTSNNDPKNTGPGDPTGGGCVGGGGGGAGPIPIPFPNGGMAASRVHLMLVNLNLIDTPVGYSPPVGPAIGFTVRYSHREAFQPSTFTYSNFGPKWTCDWISYITDNPQSLSADVNHYVQGGGTRTYTGFNPSTQTFAFQQYDQTRLTRIATNPISYEMLSGSGSKLIFSQSDGSIGTSRKIFLTQIIDPFTNAATLYYDSSLRLTNITDAIGQITTLSYSNATDTRKITRATDPFGRFASFDYDSLGRLTNITDVIGLTSRFSYEGSGDFVNALITSYGTTSFTRGGSGTTRWLETLYPDGSRDRVEFNQSTGLGVPDSDAATSVPQGMGTGNAYLYARNTYYWSRSACATGYGDYTKAKIYHWLHTADVTTCSGILESTKEALEGRVWYDYDGQSSPLSVGSTDRPKHVGRVLDDGSTQLYTYGYNAFGHVTNTIDPLGRTFSYLYDTNGIDLLEVRMTRAGQNELLSKATYNNQHRPLTVTDAAGQTTTNTYNARGQLLTKTNPRGETRTYGYDANGYLISADGPLPGTSDRSTFGYDAFGRMRHLTNQSGYTLTLDYDDLNRRTRVTYPDATFTQLTYDRLDLVAIQDSAGRQSSFEYDNMRQITKRTDPLGRVTRFDWCSCGRLGGLTDALGRKTEWQSDVQGRLISKQYGDGAKKHYHYENATSRLREVIDEQLQATRYTYHRDNTLHSIAHDNALAPTPGVTIQYDPNYRRPVSMTDGIGTTLYDYHAPGGIGAMKLATVDGPWVDDTLAYSYDELGRLTNRAINAVGESWSYDPLNRVTSEANELGTFSRTFDGGSRRVSGVTYPGGQTSQYQYLSNLGDRRLQQITHRRADASVLSQFNYAYDAIGNITNWVQQQVAGGETWTASYDASDRLINVLANAGGTNLVNTSYTFDPADNRLIENVGGSQTDASFNALNQQVSTSSLNVTNATYEWDGRHRLMAIVRGSNRTEFSYDGLGRLRVIVEKQSGNTIGERRLLWVGAKIREERDTNNVVVSRFFTRGEQRGGTNLYYFSDHLGSPRELTDTSSAIKAEYGYSPFGVRKKLSGSSDSTFGFTGLLSHDSSETLFAVYRAYSPRTGRWLSRDPIGERGGLNLYGYVRQNPLKWTDRFGYDPDYEASYEASLQKAHQNALDTYGSIWTTTSSGGTIWDTVNHFTKITGTTVDVLTKVGTGMDIAQTSWSVTKAVIDPSIKNISDATVNCGELFLAVVSPQTALTVKVIHLAYEWGVFDTVNYELINTELADEISRDEMRLLEDISREQAGDGLTLEDLWK